MKLKRIAALTLSTLMAASMLSACGGATAPATPEAPAADAPAAAAPAAPATPAAPTAEKVTLKVSTWDNTSNPAIANTIAAFEAKEPNIKIDLIDIPSADYTQKLSVMLNGGSDLDAFWIKDADSTKSLFDKGQLANIAEYVAKDAIDLAAYNGLAENFKMPGGELVGLPARTDYYVLYYNKDIFDAAGVAYPTNDMTWDQFRETAKKITTGTGAEKKYGALIHTWQACVQNWGVQDAKHTIMDTDYTFFKPYYDMALGMQNDDKSIQDYATLKSGNIHYSSPFLLGNVGMMPMGTWFMTTMIDKVKIGESTTNWGVATIPHASDVEAGYTVGSATPLVMNNASKNKDAAWKFISFATSAAGAEIYSKAGAIPGRADATMLKNIATMEGMPEGVLEALAVKNITLDRPMVDKVSEVNQMLKEEHDLIMLGEIAVDAGLAEMAVRTKEIQGK